MLSVVGNQSIDVITLLESHLQVPIHFSFRSFSFLETSFTSTSIPQLLSSISTGIMTSTLLPASLSASSPFSSEPLKFGFWLLWPMTATWPSLNPYTVPPLWATGSALCWSSALVWVTPYSSYCPSSWPVLGFCASNVLKHNFCDYGSLLEITCSNTRLMELFNSS